MCAILFGRNFPNLFLSCIVLLFSRFFFAGAILYKRRLYSPFFSPSSIHHGRIATICCFELWYYRASFQWFIAVDVVIVVVWLGYAEQYKKNQNFPKAISAIHNNLFVDCWLNYGHYFILRPQQILVFALTSALLNELMNLQNACNGFIPYSLYSVARKEFMVRARATERPSDRSTQNWISLKIVEPEFCAPEIIRSKIMLNIYAQQMRCEPSNRNIHVCAFSAAQTEWKNISIFGPLSVSARFCSTRAVSIWFICRSLCDFAFHFSRICVVFLCVLHVDFQLICLPTSVRQRQSFFSSLKPTTLHKYNATICQHCCQLSQWYPRSAHSHTTD